MPRTATLEQTLFAIHDIEATQRWSDFVVSPPQPQPALRPGYLPFFSENYIDPGAWKAEKPVPQFMVMAYKRLAYLLLDFAFMVRPVPHASHASYFLLPERVAQLREAGYSVSVSEYLRDYDSECLMVRTTHGLFFAPLNWSAELQIQELWSHPTFM